MTETTIEPNRPALSPEEENVLNLLQTHTYDQIRQITNDTWSRGRIYNLALRMGARKTETRIRERAAERRERQKETLLEMIGTTVKADVLDFLDGLPDDSVQLVLTSIPYNVGKRYGDSLAADSMRHVFYHGFVMQVISEASRVLKPGGVLFLQIGQTRDWQDRLIPLDVLLFEDIRRAGLSYQSRIIWTMPHGLTPKHRLAERYETALVCSKGDSHVFNPDAARTPQKDPGKRAFKGPNKGELSGHPFGAFPTNVWSDIGNVGHNHPDRKFGDHPAQFPLALAKRAIMLYSMPGDLVCDPFSGSGTTQVAAIEAGRAFVGADLFYEDLRARRLSRAGEDNVTPLPGVTAESIAVWQAEARRVDFPIEKPTPEATGDLFAATGSVPAGRPRRTSSSR